MYEGKCQQRDPTANFSVKNIKYASNTQLVGVTHNLQILTSAVCINSILNCSNPFFHSFPNSNNHNSDDSG